MTMTFRDLMNEEGAQDLKRLLEEKWSGKSGAVTFRIVTDSGPRKDGKVSTALYVVRSNLVRGLPP